MKTVAINGRLYDAKTGKVVSAASSTPKTGQALAQGQHMDGVSRRKAAHTQPAKQESIKPAVAGTAHAVAANSSKKFAQDVMPPKPHRHIHAKSHQAVATAHRSSTLRRAAVNKPVSKPKPHLHAKSAPTGSSIQSRVETSATGRGMLLKKVPETKLVRAMSAPKSALVSRFGRDKSNKPVLSDSLTVKAAPGHSHGKSAHHPQPAQAAVPVGKALTSKQSRSVFEENLLRANSHLEKPVKKAGRRHSFKKLRISPKVVSMAAAACAVIVLGGFFAYQHVPSFGMRVAANKAGFMGRLPSNVPAGFAFKGPIQASPDNIALTYESRTDNGKFIILQKPTNWSSESLLTNYLIDSQFRYQVYRDKGLTVYIYNGGNATWVDKGIWYSVNSTDNSLSSEQLLEIASNI